MLNKIEMQKIKKLDHIFSELKNLVNKDILLPSEIEEQILNLIVKKQIEKRISVVEQDNAVQAPAEFKRTEDQIDVEEEKKELTNTEITKYSRQMILPEIGVKGQIKLKYTSFFVVGAGGLGCPVLQYLVGAGARCIGIIDNDIVDLSNLHRQILHTELNIGTHKTVSAKYELLLLNRNAKIQLYHKLLCKYNAIEILKNYDVIIDCSDNVATRYLLNDACYLLGKPLVSGSALKFEGQLTVYNYKSGPCYRCIFPIPPPPEAVTNCGDAGILGPVTGVIGSLQALEAIKIAIGMDGVLNGRLLLFDGLTTSFRNVKLREKRKNCELCSDQPIITDLIDYEQFCGARATDKCYSLKILNESERIGVLTYKNILDNIIEHLLIDVRNPIEYEMCHLNNSINIPLKNILEDRALQEINEKVKDNRIPVFLLCRRGNDSQIAVQHLKQKLHYIEFKDIIGGLQAWHKIIDTSFPTY